VTYGCAIPTGQTTGKCAALVANGQACLTGTKPCDADLACVGDDEATQTMGQCMPEGAATGAPCDSTHKAQPTCDNNLGLVCIPTAANSTVGTCQPFVLAAAGAACGQMGGNPFTSVVDCEAGAVCINKVCVAPAADGAACDSVKGPPCLLPARCVPSSMGSTAGTCTVPDPTKCM
jgi:hypothetical protein